MRAYYGKTALLAFILAFSLPAQAQLKGLPLSEISGKTNTKGSTQEQTEIDRQQVRTTTPAPQSAPTSVPEAGNDLSWLDGMSCPGKGVLIMFISQDKPLCNNGYVLTPKGPVDVHCEYLYFSFYNANFSGCDLSGMDMSGLRLQAADFTGADLTGANFSNTDLRFSRFDGAQVVDTRFDGANLSSTVWHDSLIERATFSAANMTSAVMWSVNIPVMVIADSSFQGVKGPLYTKWNTHWVNTICPGGSQSNQHARQCKGQGVVVGL